MKKISIIIPIYNVEEYIDRLIKSLINQTYSNIEVILVDDGSPDKCGSIIDEYAKKDNRIIAIHQDNGGVSSARNSGLRNANGEYIMFVDGDDYVDEDYVEYFVNLIESNNAQIGYGRYNYNEQTSISSNNTYVLDNSKAIEWIYDGTINVAVWNKIYSMDLLRNNNIKFSEDVWYGEGMLFNIKTLQYVDKIAIGEKCTYHQTFNPNSAMRNFSLNSNYCGIASLWLQRALIKSSNEDIEHAWEYHRYRFNRSIIDGMIRSKKIDNKLFKECVRNLRRDILLPIKYEKKLKTKMGYICYCIAPRFMANRSKNKFNNTLIKVKSGGGI